MNRYIWASTPLPPQRFRRLTISSLSDDEEVNLRTYRQSRSFLFRKLPPEIRQRIYLYTLGEKTVHIIQMPSGLGHVTCLEPCYPNLNSHACWLIKMSNSRVSSVSYLCSDESWYGVRDGLLNILRTCRQVYSEAIDLLYAGNTFDMPNPRSIALLAETVLPHRLNQIRSIHMSGSFLPFQAKHEWDKCWSILSTMKHLNHLRIQLWDESDLITSSFEEEMFGPAWSVILTQKWEIITSWGDTGAHFEGAPFQVVRNFVE